MDETVGRGLSEKNFRRVASNGIGDPLNAYPHSMGWFKDHLYVGTTRGNLANRARQIQAQTPERMGEIWPVPIPESTFSIDLRAEIWRYSPPADEWVRAYSSATKIGVDGYEVPISIGFRSMCAFQGRSDPAPAFYVPCWGTHQTMESIMLRSYDGLHFEECDPVDPKLPDYALRSVRGLVSFKGWLFASPAVGKKRFEPNIAEKMLVLVTDDPAHGPWHLAAEPHFGNPNNLSVFNMGVFDDHLYAGTLNIQNGCEVWKTKAEGKPPFQWTRVLAGGAHRGKLNQIAMTLTPFNDALYVGTAIQNCSFDYAEAIGPAAPEILKIYPDDSWEIAVGDPRQTPEGLKVPLSGLTSGFGNPFSGYLWSMCAHDGWLYAATAVWMVFLRYAGRHEKLPPQLQRLLTSANLDKILRDFGGADFWRTRDGYNWYPVSVNGFGNCFNIGFRNQVSSPYGLFVGAANPFGPEVAVRRIAGWRYEYNPRGGLEVWHGSPDYPPASAAEEPATHARTRDPEPDEVLDDFFRGSGFRHTGMWGSGMLDADEACENLLAEVLAFFPDKEALRGEEGSVLELACGQGATTRSLARYVSPESITAVTTDAAALFACRERCPEVRFLRRKPGELLRLDGDARFDLVFWARGDQPLGPRAKLLRQVRERLRDGGRLVAFEVLPRDEPAGVLKRLVGRREPCTLEAYRTLLEDAGFEGLELHDVTEATLGSLRQHLAQFLALNRLTSFPGVAREVLEERLGLANAGTCLLVSAVVPQPVDVRAAADGEAAQRD